MQNTCINTVYYYLDIINGNACIFKIRYDKEKSDMSIELTVSMMQTPIYTLSKESIRKIITNTSDYIGYKITKSNVFYPKSLNIEAFIDALEVYRLTFSDSKNDQPVEPSFTKIDKPLARYCSSRQTIEDRWYFQRFFRDGNPFMVQLTGDRLHDILMCMSELVRDN